MKDKNKTNLNLIAFYLIFALLIPFSIVTASDQKSSQNNKDNSNKSLPQYFEYSFDGKYQIIAEKEEIKIIDLNENKIINTISYISSGQIMLRDVGKNQFVLAKDKPVVSYFVKEGPFNYSLITSNYLTGKKMGEFELPKLSISFGLIDYNISQSEDGNLIGFTWFGEVIIYSTIEKKVLYKKDLKEDIKSLSICPNGDKIAISYNTSIELWDIKKDKLIKSFSEEKEISALLCLNDDTIICGFDNLIVIKDIKKNKVIKKLGAGVVNVKRLMVDKNRKWLSYSGENILNNNTAIYVWELYNHKLVAEFMIPNLPAIGAFHPFNNKFSVLFSNKEIKEYSLERLEAPVIVPQIGHSGDIQSIDFSYDKKLMVTTSSGFENTIILWDVKLGKKLNSFKSNFLKKAYFYPNSYNIVFEGYEPHIVYLDTIKNYSEYLNPVSYGNFEAKEIFQKLELDNKIDDKLIDEFKNQFGLKNKEDITSSKKLLAAKYYDRSDNKTKLLLQNSKTKKFTKIVLNSTFHPFSSEPIKFYSSELVAIPRKDNSIAFFNIKSREIEKIFPGYKTDVKYGVSGYMPGTKKLIFSKYGSDLLSYHDSGKLNVWNLTNASLYIKLLKKVNDYNSKNLVNFSENLLTFPGVNNNDVPFFQISYLKSQKNDLIMYVEPSRNISQGDIRFVTAKKFRLLNFAAISPDNKLLAMLVSINENKKFNPTNLKIKPKDWKNEIDIWDLEKLEIKETIQLLPEYFKPNIVVSPNFKYVVVWENNGVSEKIKNEAISVPNQSFAYISNRISIIDLNTFKTTYLKLNTFKIDRIGENDIQFSPNDDDIILIRDDFNSILKIINFKKKKIIKEVDRASEIINLSGLVGEKVKVGGIYSPFTVDRDSKYIYQTGSNPSGLNENNEILQVSTNKNRTVFKIDAKNDRFISLGHNNNSSLLAIGFLNNSILIFDMVKKKEIVKIYNQPDYYLFLINENYYKTSSKKGKNLFFRVNNRLYNFEQFDLKLNRPDKVIQKLGFASEELINSYYKAYQKRLEKMKFTEEMLSDEWHIPEIDILNKDDIPFHSKNQKLTLDLKASDSKVNLDRVNIWVNDVSIYGIKGIDLKKLKTNNFIKKISVKLSQGINKIQVSALNQDGAESYKETIETHFSPLKKRKPDLMLIGIGVSQYQNIDTLKFVDNDAIDLVKKFKMQEGKLFNRVYDNTIVNHNVNKDILTTLKQKLNRTKVDDYVIIFYSGHGDFDKKKNYYLYTFDINPNDLAGRGILYDDLVNLLDGIPARKKLLLVNACKSGEVDQDMPTFEIMRALFSDLRRGTGSIIISSSASDEFSFTGSKKFGENSAFGFAFKNILSSNRELRVSELVKYLDNEVPKLTRGKQKPTIRNENLELDFRIW